MRWSKAKKEARRRQHSKSIRRSVVGQPAPGHVRRSGSSRRQYGKGCGGPRCGSLWGMATTATTERAAGWGVEATATTAAKATAPADMAAARAAEAATAMALHNWGPSRCHICLDHLARLVLKATCAYARRAICDRINRERKCSFSCACRLQVGMPGTGATWGPLRMGVGRANLWRAFDATPARMPFRPAEHACHPRDAEKRGIS